ncbi:MAG: response regulator transcription factor [Deltaproteobacteria bacterium]|nr:response regulator transcription factor [Deltaproteobacteria bacterium]
MSSYRILLADDHALIREGVKSVIEQVPDLKLVGEVGDGLELLKFLKTTPTDLIILDISMPHLDGLEALKKIKADYPKAKVLILTMHKSKGYMLQAFSAGADGYLLKGNAYDDLFTAIEGIRQGGHYISSLMSNQIVDLFRHEGPGQSLSEHNLSQKELSVLKLIAQGKSTKQIAEQLSIALPTVQYHRNSLKKKLNINTNAGLIKYALEREYAAMD